MGVKKVYPVHPIDQNKIWSFVQENYPNYEISDEIAREEDLAILLYGDEGEKDERCKDLIEKQFGGDPDNPKIEEYHKSLLLQIYEQAILNYVKKQEREHETGKR